MPCSIFTLTHHTASAPSPLTPPPRPQCNSASVVKKLLSDAGLCSMHACVWCRLGMAACRICGTGKLLQGLHAAMLILHQTHASAYAARMLYVFFINMPCACYLTVTLPQPLHKLCTILMPSPCLQPNGASVVKKLMSDAGRRFFADTNMLPCPYCTRCLHRHAARMHVDLCALLCFLLDSHSPPLLHPHAPPCLHPSSA